MKTITKERIASVAVTTSKLSEDEVALYEAALSYALDSLSDHDLEQRLGASREEVEGTRDDLRQTLDELREASELSPSANSSATFQSK